MHGTDKLLEMLTYKRPAGSRAERQFIRRFIRPTGAEPDNAGNYILRIGDNSRVAWLSHTDTVHRKSGRQRLRVEDGLATVRYPQATLQRECLGADDTTGVWLMLEMIGAEVPGLYIFHRAEERGCIGSAYIARHTPELLDGIHYAVAFDRRGIDSVITHQLGNRTASDVFAWSLIDALGLIGYGPDPTGVYTDSESYAGLVPECTNLSVGYEYQHTPQECQDIEFAAWLRDRLCRMDENDLLRDRDPVDVWAMEPVKEPENWEDWDEDKLEATFDEWWGKGPELAQ